MQVTTIQHEHDPNATSPNWLAPLTMLVAWLVSLLTHIARLKRIRATTTFKPYWTDSWNDLRRLEWHRDQMLAQGAALLLAGKALDDAEAQLTDPPHDYGGPRPATPFQMQRRFLAIAEWLKDPEAMIRRHAARIAKRIDLALPRDPLRHVAVRRASCAHDGLSRRSAAKAGRGLSASRARAPPTPAPTADCRLPNASLAPPARTPPRARDGATLETSPGTGGPVDRVQTESASRTSPES